jgi:hypothetical protein
MSSKYLSALSVDEYAVLTKKLCEIQKNECYICGKDIRTDLNNTNIDHIIPLANKGKDCVENFAVTHESCNKSKQDANLEIARKLQTLSQIQEEALKQEGKSGSLKHLLAHYKGSKFDFKSRLVGDVIEYSFSDIANNKIHQTPIFNDNLSKEKSCFIEVPIEYLFHDELINPRGINNSISKLVKEFDKGNPQLHLSLARLDRGKIKVFDGQHKAAAQILLGTRILPLRVFIEPNVERLTEANTNAGSSLRQIAFDKAIMRQLSNTLYMERVRQYQKDHKLSNEDYSFSEEDLARYFKGENKNIKKYIVEHIKHTATQQSDNKLKDYIDFEGKAKELPISHSAFDKTFLSIFIDNKTLSTPINYKMEEGLNPRELEISQLAQFMNIVAEEIYIGRFIPEVGVYRIENRIIEGKDNTITGDHLAAFRLSKEETVYNWLLFVNDVILNYFAVIGKRVNRDSLFQTKFDDQLWINIRNFIKNLRELPLWKDKSMASTTFSGKNNYDFWETVFKTGKRPDGVLILAKPLDIREMISPLEAEK